MSSQCHAFSGDALEGDGDIGMLHSWGDSPWMGSCVNPLSGGGTQLMEVVPEDVALEGLATSLCFLADMN